MNDIYRRLREAADQIVRDREYQQSAQQTTQPAQTVQSNQPSQKAQSNQPASQAVVASNVSSLNSAVGILIGMTQNGQMDQATAGNLFQDIYSSRSNPQSPYYYAYSSPTNRARSELESMGVDFSVPKDQLNATLTGYLAYAKTGNGVSQTPTISTKSTPSQRLAYWSYYYLGAEDTTQQLQDEASALENEIRFWANREGRNYSYDEVIGKIDWSRYPGIRKAKESAAEGNPTRLNEAVDFSDSAMEGWYYSALNPDDQNRNSWGWRYALGHGNVYTRDESVSRRLDAQSDDYNPYAVGSTADELCLYFGVQSFPREWSAKNRSYIGNGNDKDQSNYAKVVKAEVFTQKAEEQRRSLYALIDEKLKLSDDPNTILDSLLYDFRKNYPELYDIDKSLDTGAILPTTRAIDYSWRDVEKYV